ncbi:tRNA (N6-isopentenyl adenosine(37)-C2)-methylthiotransferase MiaB [Roseococcus sp.]|uniref:tRNA (N6-isopentenyl adenosine(37)-C2)-methylthiotransferase MiaB n=1 Tax=Roseococcus sp. TaxID=2109646 RepID=UPI003BABBF90
MTHSTPPAALGAKKRLFLRSWGCQMNVYDTGRMADVLAPLGYEPVDAPEGADMIILNTCHIREKATDKLFSELGRLRGMKEKKQAAGGEMVLAVAGCVAQAEGKEIVIRAPWVDIVLGPQSYHRLPEMVARAGRAARAVVETDFPVEEKFDHLPEASAPQGVTAFLTIQEGCDKFCSFCVVPYTRGSEYSRPAQAVLAEARRMVAQGTREISLLGQNVNAYHGEGPDGREWGLARLLYALAEIPGLDRLRYTTSHPRDIDEAQIAAHRDIPAVMPFLHLPVQSGSDRMLEAMNRGHTAEEYIRLVDRLREARPDIAFSTDIISGHPGEKDEDHAATMALIRRVGFAQFFSFKYSPRPGTPAAGAPYRVDEATKDRRLQEVQALLIEQQAAFNASKTGQTVPVLFTGAGRQPGQFSGRTPWLQPVHVAGDASLLGQIVPVRILAGQPYSLHGELLHALQQEKNAA